MPDMTGARADSIPSQPTVQRSPVIDAGPDETLVADFGGTWADLGLYGGGLPFDQFDDQRDDTTTAPWIFPMFDTTGDVGAIGDLPIKAIGIARTR